MKISVLGAGYWGRNIIRNALCNELIDEVIICEPNKNAIQENWITNKKVSLKTSYSDILNDKDVSSVFIVTPADSHFELARRAIISGKDVFIEKPITTSSAEISELISLAEKHRVNIFPSQTYLHTEEIEKISNSINLENNLGNPLMYQSNRSNLGRFRADVNVAWDLAIHDLYIVQHLFDKRAISVTATGIRSHKGFKETACNLHVKYENNFNAFITVNWLSPIKFRDVMITGTEGSIFFDDCKQEDKISNIELQIPNDLSNFDYGKSIQIQPIHSSPIEAISRQLQEFISFSKAGYKGVSKAVKAKEVIRILECADISMSKNGLNVLIN